MEVPATERLDFYVYILFRPDGRPCYVGKGKGDRWLQHAKKSHNSELGRLISQSSEALPVVRVRDNISEREAFETEIALIKAIGRVGVGGLLLNLTDGGEGVCGHRRTAEQRQRMSVARTGRKQSEETKAHLRIVMPRLVKSEAHCAAISAAKKGVSNGPLSPEHAAAIGNAHRGRKRGAEEMASVMAGIASRTPEMVAQKSARISAALTGKKLSLGHRAKISAIQKGVPKGPMTDAHRAACSVAALARWKSSKTD